MSDRTSVSRRRFLQGLSAAGGVTLAGCAGTDLANPGTGNDGPAATPRSPPGSPADATTAVTAAPGAISPGGDGSASASTWLYGDEFPGSELRVTEGDVVEAAVTNDLPEGTSVHWHGLPVSNSMDGVPNVTQDPIAPGDSFTYTFRADPASTYFYHSHAGLQLDRGLMAPLIVEESDPTWRTIASTRS